MSQHGGDAQNPYTGTSTRPNDPGSEVVQLVMDWARSHRNALTSTEATNVGTAVTSILNGTYHI